MLTLFPGEPDRDWIARSQLIRNEPSLFAEERKSDAHVEQAIATEIAALPNSIRGFGHVKQRNAEAAEQQRAALLATRIVSASSMIAAMSIPVATLIRIAIALTVISFAASAVHLGYGWLAVWPITGRWLPGWLTGR